jgi:hypothetical protein
MLSGTLTADYATLFGATASPSTTASMLAAWPAVGYSREYGKDGPDADTFTDLMPDETNKYAVPWWDIGGCRLSNHPTWPEFEALAEVLA